MAGIPLLTAYTLALFAISLVGSWLPRRVEMTHTRTQMVLSFVSGLMLGVALLHLIPHSFVAAGEIDTGHGMDARGLGVHVVAVAFASLPSA